MSLLVLLTCSEQNAVLVLKTTMAANSMTSNSSSASSFFVRRDVNAALAPSADGLVHSQSEWLGGKRCSASLVKGNNGQMLGYQVKDDVEHPLFFVPNVYYSKSDMEAIEKVDKSQHRLNLFARKGWFGDYYLEAKASG